ncbi:hypothetical protein I7I50_05785 [Histoplasma capsulatum G186AR]|uniref:Uncharacterized protein n=1 Tax=Ajellomyces capsulatus TaxID=5037 RepID=A0A8H8D974_AJECA|nr:hypothetical protein I7I52_04044 [Histoplasma capsulatum]QSS76364.1 hypothetical protein I7I50_05785 [Histoplasma capsulatum G186AR]
MTREKFGLIKDGNRWLDRRFKPINKGNRPAAVSAYGVPSRPLPPKHTKVMEDNPIYVYLIEGYEPSIIFDGALLG